MMLQSETSLHDTGKDSALLTLSVFFQRVLQYPENNATILYADKFSIVQYLSSAPPLRGWVIGAFRLVKGQCFSSAPARAGNR